MFELELAMTIGCAVLMALTVQPAAIAHVTLNRTMYVTFSGRVQLPGVTLDAGTYVFELADPIDAWDVVRVLSRRRDRVYFQGFTQRVERPAGLRRNQVVALGEAAKGIPAPILIWYPEGESTGRQFIYPTH
jgi:hypothetical protein